MNEKDKYMLIQDTVNILVTFKTSKLIIISSILF